MNKTNPTKKPVSKPKVFQTSIRLNEDLVEKVKSEAEAEGRSFSNMLERILLEYWATKAAEKRDADRK